MEDIKPNVRKSKKGGSVKAEFFVWRGFIAIWEEKLKMVTFTEAPFMVKSDFEDSKYFFQIFAQKILGKIFETLTNIQLDPFSA